MLLNLRWLSWLASVVLFCAASPALAAPTRVAVLKLADESADATGSAALAEALRAAVRAQDSFEVSDARVSLDQLSMVNDCDPGSSSCQRQIAKSLSVDALIYGSVDKVQAGARVTLSYSDFRAGAGKTTQAEHTFGSATPTDAERSEAAQALVATLLGREPPQPDGSDEPAAVVAPADAASAEHAARPARVEPEYDDAPESSGVSTRAIAGYSLLGVAVVSAGLSVVSFVQIDRAQGNDSLYDYRVAIGQQDPSVKDVCAEADKNERYGLSAARFAEVRDECGAAGTYELLQFVFIGTAVVSGGLSAYLLLTDDDTAGGEHASRSKTFALRPAVGRSSASLTARVRF